MDQETPVEIRIQAQMKYVCAVRATVGAISEKFDIPKKMASKVVLAVEEAMTNVIRHGYRGPCDQPIWVKLAPIMRDEVPGIEIIMEDLSENVDIATIKSRPLEEYRPGGLGVHIIRSFMDEVEYTHLPGGGLRLRIVKLATEKPMPPMEGEDGDGGCGCDDEKK